MLLLYIQFLQILQYVNSLSHFIANKFLYINLTMVRVSVYQNVSNNYLEYGYFFGIPGLVSFS